MIFSSSLFFAFYILVFFIHWFIIPVFFTNSSRKSARHVFLLITSYVFYMSWDWKFGFLMMLTTVIDYIAGLILEYSHKKDSGGKLKKIILLCSIILNLGILGYFKYADFFIGSFVDFINTLSPGSFSPDEKNSLLLNVILPLGISFFTFQSMSYTIDVYRKIIPAEKSIIRFALFVAFFPQLVAGPIVVAKDFLPQLNKDPEFDNDRLLKAARWFLLGYFKKSVIADNMSVVVDQIYAHPEAHGSYVHWLGAAAFCIQIYCDFSGYTDMAWGTALGLGYRLPVNFNMPYKSTSITEFWQRWHISLIKWIRDYLYIPLGGNRVSPIRHKFNIFITMFLAGVWHGANWTFVFWGATQGIAMVIENITKSLFKRQSGVPASQEKTGGIQKTLLRYQKSFLLFAYTMFLTMISATIFRANTIQDFFLIFTRMFALDHFTNTFPASGMLTTVVWGITALFFGHWLGHWIFESGRFKWKIHPAFEIAAAPFLILLFTQIAASDVEAFVYFVF